MSTFTKNVPGASITYDIHGELTAGSIPLLLIGSPMDAGGFATLAAHFPDRTVVTYDPRNTGRSTRDDPTAAVTVAQHADDLHALLGALGSGPVDMFASSGGAVNALELVARYPDDLRVLVAHEPPAGGALADRAALESVCSAMVSTYDSSGLGPAMAQFIALVMHRGELDSEYLARPVPDPSAFGLPTEDDGDRTDPLMANMRGGVVEFVPDVEAVKAARTRTVVAVGADSGGPSDGELAARSAYAVAELLGTDAVVFPGGHADFSGERAEEFAAALREVLA
ncbi:alpha/beta fold hydrolase [Rhodococcus sp. KRD162]|uniref:alpha/beta fold hydrolase n=1 Tax=Rhodococcus sp. KRD162 TaxID=2729725 RepID=UPI0019D30F29|nr:alpha/beta hydrolase [Rhodococcus sp. KRD162]